MYGHCNCVRTAATLAVALRHQDKCTHGVDMGRPAVTPAGEAARLASARTRTSSHVGVDPENRNEFKRLQTACRGTTHAIHHQEHKEFAA